MEPTLDQHGLDLYDELIKKFIENLGDIADVVPNEVIKALWDREITFDELVPVSGERHLTPCSKDVNLVHFLNIFYDIEKVKANAVTFTATYPNDSFRLSLSRRDGNPILFQIVDDQLKRWYYDKESIEAAPGESIQIVGLGDELHGFSSQFVIDAEHTVEVSGNIMSLIDIVGDSRVIPCEGCFSYLFVNNPIYDASHLLLPATTLKPWCYERMFSDCVYLEGAPELPAEHLAEGCYSEMFSGCTSLTNPPELPVTILAASCYGDMFSNCRSLITAPELPATILAAGCYSGMFSNCRSLITAPDLPATILVAGCYSSMFDGCASLATVPELPATILAAGCYSGMFRNCSELVVAPELPANILYSNCYQSMFADCTSLKESPILPAKTLANYCYDSMFRNCSHLSKITCLAEVDSHRSLTNWTVGVSSSGTFLKSPNADFWSVGLGGIPRNWEVKDYNSYEYEYLTLEALEDSNVGWYTNYYSEIKPTIEYSFDKVNWNTFMGEVEDETYYPDMVAVRSGQKLYIRGTNPDGVSNDFNWNSDHSNGFVQDYGSWDVYGNIQSILYGDDFVGQKYMKGNFFELLGGELKEKNGLNVIHAHNLVLPVKDLSHTIEEGRYACMFLYCNNLITAPELPATTLATNCYSNMFKHCTNLLTAPELTATTLAYYCYHGMFDGCASLASAPELPVTTLVVGCYQDMFNDCTSLNHIKCLAIDKSAVSCTSGWVYNVSPSGTFIKHPDANWVDGQDGIPTEWTIEDAEVTEDESDFSLDLS